jgi:GT2 family glycosyltransferase
VHKCVYVILLNWRGWSDTVACLESLFAGGGPALRVVVCDNDSGDGSLDRIIDWAGGAVLPERPAHPRLARLVGTASRRPRWQRVDRQAAEAGRVDADAELILVDNGANLGFAAGNNVGLRLALASDDMDCVWLLNNDTLVEPDCLMKMRDTLARAGDRAVCGSVIHFFDRPEVIQAVGGNGFNRFTGIASRSEGRFLHESQLHGTAETAATLSYLSGCSMLLPRAFLEQVGLMSEDYFLYYEEIDWFTRNRDRFPIVIAGGARLYHREGSAIGSPGWQRAASILSDRHMYRSRLIYMRKYRRRWLALCYLAALVEAGKRMLRGQRAGARVILSELWSALRVRATG